MSDSVRDRYFDLELICPSFPLTSRHSHHPLNEAWMNLPRPWNSSLPVSSLLGDPFTGCVTDSLGGENKVPDTSWDSSCPNWDIYSVDTYSWGSPSKIPSQLTRNANFQVPTQRKLRQTGWDKPGVRKKQPQPKSLCYGILQVPAFKTVWNAMGTCL